MFEIITRELHATLLRNHRVGPGPSQGKGRDEAVSARASPSPLLLAALLEHLLQGGSAARADLLVGDLFGGGQQVGGGRSASVSRGTGIGGGRRGLSGSGRWLGGRGLTGLSPGLSPGLVPILRGSKRASGSPRRSPAAPRPCACVSAAR